MSILQLFDRMGLDCTSPQDQATFCATSAAEAFLDDQAMHEIYGRPGSHFAAIDQCPKSLLNCGGGGLIGRAHHRLKLARAGLPSKSNISLEAGIFKGKLPRHLVAADRPFRMTSPILRGESNRAKGLQQDTMEVTGAYPKNPVLDLNTAKIFGF